MKIENQAILSQLKFCTKVYHDELERRLDPFHSLTTLADYAVLLQKFLGFFLPIEAQLATLQERFALPLDLERRRKSGLLLQDLSAIGMQHAALHHIPLCQDLPTLVDPAHVWGCLYVLEGATLGGVFISKHLKEQFGLTAEYGCAYFRSYGSEVGSMWRAFLSMLISYTNEHQVDMIIMNSACETFAKLSQWLLEEV